MARRVPNYFTILIKSRVPCISINIDLCCFHFFAEDTLFRLPQALRRLSVLPRVIRKSNERILSIYARANARNAATRAYQISHLLIERYKRRFISIRSPALP